MKANPISTKVSWFVAAVSAALMVSSLSYGDSPQAAAAGKPAAVPSHRVIACYFHRTHRCPTCKKISAYIEEAIRAGFAREIGQRRVAMHLIDFQDPKNARYTKDYKIKGPTLLVIDVHDNKVTAWKRAPKVWSLVGKKEEFFKYVQGEVRSYLEGK